MTRTLNFSKRKSQQEPKLITSEANSTKQSSKRAETASIVITAIADDYPKQ